MGCPVEKRPMGRPSHHWEEDIKMDHRKTRWEGAGWRGTDIRLLWAR